MTKFKPKKLVKRKRTHKPKPTIRNAGPTDKVQLLAYVDPRIHTELKRECAERRMTFGEIITEALRARVWFVRRDGTGQVVEQALGAPEEPLEIDGRSAARLPGLIGIAINAPEQPQTTQSTTQSEKKP